MCVLQTSGVQVKGDKGTLFSITIWHADAAHAAG